MIKRAGLIEKLFFGMLFLGMTSAFSVQASVALGTTRVIYPSDQKQVQLTVNNNDKKSTYLIQSWVENMNGQKDGLFVITPPLFAMQGKKRIRCVLLMRLMGDYQRIEKAFFGLV